VYENHPVMSAAPQIPKKLILEKEKTKTAAT
jgi:hypothetical protein